MGPRGPNILALAGPGKPYEIFERDHAYCTQKALQTEQSSPEAKAAMYAALGGLAGAALGAGIGAATGSPATGAAIGGTTGVALGAASGTNAAQQMAAQQQLRLNNTFASCMYGYGHAIPNLPIMSR